MLCDTFVGRLFSMPIINKIHTPLSDEQKSTIRRISKDFQVNRFKTCTQIPPLMYKKSIHRPLSDYDKMKLYGVHSVWKLNGGFNRRRSSSSEW